MTFQSRTGATRGTKRAPITIDIVAQRVGESAVFAAPEPEPQSRTDAFRAAVRRRSRRLLQSADRHAFTLSSLTLALGVGWLIGAHTFAEPGGAARQNARDLSAREALAQAQTASMRGEIVELRKTLETAQRREAEAAAALEEAMQTAQRTPEPQASQQTTIVAQNVLQPLPASVRASIPPRGYVLRQANEKLALIESREGLRAVEPGQWLPGAGKVHAIQKRGERWIVVTANGVIDSDFY